MATVSQLNPYRCDHCGTSNIVAAPVLYQQETRAYSGTFTSGTSQSYFAQAVAPPSMRGYLRPLVLWGPANLILFVWTIVGFSSIFEHPTTTVLSANALAVFLVLLLVSLSAMLFSFRKIALYNRDIYPRLHWNWEHTYICKHCGKLRLILS